MDRTPPLDALGPASAFARLHEASRADLDPSWSDRADRLVRLRTLLQAHRGDFAAALAADFGQRAEAEITAYELLPSVLAVEHALRHGRRWMRVRRVGANWWTWPGRCEIRPQPLGVVGVMSPWNYPLYLSVGPLVDALAAGNRVMIKLSEHAPAFAARFRDAVARTFAPDEVAVVLGGVDVATAFAALPFDHLVFTGSTAVGRDVMRAAAANLTPVTLELGGKSPALIGPTAHLQAAAESLLRGKLANAGQTCIAPDYVLVPREQTDAFVSALRVAAASADETQRDPALRTHVIGDRQLTRLRRWLQDAVDAGARVEPLLAAPVPARGREFPPMLLFDCPANSMVMREEIFGPLLPIVPYDTLDEALAHVQARPRPLALYIFDDDPSVVERVLRHTVSGGVTVNDTLLHIVQHGLPFGGVGDSGTGAYHGEAGFRRFSHLKPVFRQSRLRLFDRLRPPSGRLFVGAVRWMIGR